MAHHPDDEFSAIDPAALDQVTGGKDASSGTGSGSSSNNDALTAALEGITSTLKDLKNNNNGNNIFTQMMPFMLMAFARGGSITIGGGGAACGCGCGGHGRCCRR